MHELTQASVEWMLGATAHTHPRIDPVYTLDGSVVRSQRTAPLTGYRRTAPVHIGNDAGSQLQLGGFGDLIETICTYVGAGHILDRATGERLADVADLLAALWPTADSGLWELGDRAQYGSSKLAAWVAFARIAELADGGQVPARHPGRWRGARDDVRAYIERELYSETRRSYLMDAGSDRLDCAMLLTARRGFGDPSGERIKGTIDAIGSELHAGGPLLYRYSGMQDEENAFLACTFWMVEALALSGRRDEAAELMEQGVRLSNGVGLLTEEMEPSTHALRGNMPQALTHLSLISAAHAVSDG
jgi:GH15 family glucan-1,4-alpha-glucosidase